MDAADKRMLEREALRTMIQQWNANRLDLFELSEPNEVSLHVTVPRTEILAWYDIVTAAQCYI
jgi:hypothetical protein